MGLVLALAACLIVFQDAVSTADRWQQLCLCYCVLLGLRVRLLAGTLLGAVRNHKCLAIGSLGLLLFVIAVLRKITQAAVFWL